MSYSVGSFFLQNKSRLYAGFLFCKSSLVFENQQARRALGEESSGFADGRRSAAASPDSENIEHTWTEGSSAKLFERGANPRQPGEFFIVKTKAGDCPAFVLTKILKLDENHKAK